MNKIVLDTNVLVSALLTNGHPATIIDLVADGQLKPFYNDFIVSGSYKNFCVKRYTTGEEVWRLPKKYWMSC